jgi:hypothetical protein
MAAGKAPTAKPRAIAPRHPRPRRRLIAVIGAILLLAGQSPMPAAGDHDGIPFGPFGSCRRPNTNPPRCTSMANDLRHHVYFDSSLTADLARSMRATMAEDYEPTDFTMIEQAAITAATDVVVFSRDYGENGAAGWVSCPPDAPQGINPTGDRWCQRQELHFNLNPRYAAYFADDASRDYMTCHELGHTLGLRHWGNPPESGGPAAQTCMNADTPDGATDLHQIDVGHINEYQYVSPRRWPWQAVR